MLIIPEDFKQHAEIDSNDDDELITLYCNSVSDFIKQKLNRNIEAQTAITEYFDGDDITDTIVLKEYPVTTLTSLQYATGNIGNQTWADFDAEYYQLDEEAGQILVEAMYGGRRNIKAVYNAGYAAASIPSAIKLAAIKLVSKVYAKKRSDGFSSEEVAGARIEWAKFYSEDIEELLSPYRRVLI